MNINGINIVPSHFIEKGKAFHIENKNIVAMNDMDFYSLMLHNEKGDYFSLFDKYGVNDSTIKASAEFAKNKLS